MGREGGEGWGRKGEGGEDREDGGREKERREREEVITCTHTYTHCTRTHTHLPLEWVEQSHQGVCTACGETEGVGAEDDSSLHQEGGEQLDDLTLTQQPETTLMLSPTPKCYQGISTNFVSHQTADQQSQSDTHIQLLGLIANSPFQMEGKACLAGR